MHGINARSISKSQGGFSWEMHWSKRDCKSRNCRIETEYRGCMSRVRCHITLTPKRIWKIRSTFAVGSAGFDRRTFVLPREVSAITSWLCREVSRSRSRKSCCNDTTVAVWKVTKLVRSDAQGAVLVGLAPHQKQQPKDWTLIVFKFMYKCCFNIACKEWKVVTILKMNTQQKVLW